MKREACTTPEACRITQTTKVKEPIQEWEPIYDGNGMMVNSDPNTFVSHYSCTTCNEEWDVENTAQPPNRSSVMPTKEA